MIRLLLKDQYGDLDFAPPLDYSINTCSVANDQVIKAKKRPIFRSIRPKWHSYTCLAAIYTCLAAMNEVLHLDQYGDLDLDNFPPGGIRTPKVLKRRSAKRLSQSFNFDFLTGLIRPTSMQVAALTLLSSVFFACVIGALSEYHDPPCPSLDYCYFEDAYGPHDAYPDSLTLIPSGTYNFVCKLTGSPKSPVLFVYNGITRQESRPPYRIKDLYLPCGNDLVISVSLGTYDSGSCFDEAYHISVLGCNQCNYKCPPYSRPIPYRSCYDSFNDCECIEGYYKNGDHCVIVHSPRPPVPTPIVPIYYKPVVAPTVKPLPIEVQNNQVTCVSVIDENDRRAVDAAWLQFRNRYPDRPFCLLRAPSSTGLSVPTNFTNDPTKNILANVTRDAQDRDPITQSVWFSICNLARSRAQGLSNVVLFVDNSGSMTTATVQNAHDAFQSAVVANGMEVVAAVYNNREDYINPCFATSLVGNSTL